MNKPNDNETREKVPSEADGKKKSSRSCCFYGCLLMFLFVTLVVVGGGLSGYWWLTGQVDRFTSDTAADLPTVELSDEELGEIQSRVDKFKETIEGDDTPEDLVLTADEINAMITRDDDLRGRIYVTIKDGTVSGDVSIPTDFLPGGKGRFFNASATFDVSLENGVLIVTLSGAEVKGEKVPQQFIDGMSKENLAKELYKDPDAAATLRRIESVSIEDDKIVLKPRVAMEQPEGEGAATEDDQASTEESTDSAETSEPGEPAGADEALPDDPEAAAEAA